MNVAYVSADVTNKVLVGILVAANSLLHIGVYAGCSVPVGVFVIAPIFSVSVLVVATFVVTCVTKTVAVAICVSSFATLYVMAASCFLPVVEFVTGPLICVSMSATSICANVTSTVVI